MLGYYRVWAAFFAVLGYCLGLAFGFSDLKAFWVVPFVGIIGLFVAWLSEAQRFRIETLAWLATWGTGWIAFSNLVFGWHWWEIVPFVSIVVIIGVAFLFLLGKGPAADWADYLREREERGIDRHFRHVH